MILRTVVLLAFALVLAACGSEEAAETASPFDTYGAAITEEGAVPVQAVVAEPGQYLGRSVKVQGTVTAVCQAKGCWLTLQAGEGIPVRIVMPRTEDGSDYVFTVPVDISGRRVVVEGTLAEETLSADTRRHLAEDAGTAAGAGDLQPVQELQLTARGVLVEKNVTVTGCRLQVS